MLTRDWINHKASVMNKADKSFKQSIDAPVVDIVEYVNGLERFLTTSSCSGRIMLINEADPEKRKNGAQFIFVSHDYVSPDSATELLSKCQVLTGNVFLKLEPLIVHIECDTLELSVHLLHLMKRESVFKHSSIVSAANQKFVVSIKAMSKLEIPVMYSDDILTDEKQLRRYLEIANERMKENFDAIARLRSVVKAGAFESLTGGLSEPILPLNYADMVPALEPSHNVSTERDEIQPERNCALPAHIGRLDHSAKFIHCLSGTRVGIIPDSNGRPVIDEAVLIFALDPKLTLIQTKSSLWILVQSTKKDGGLAFCWKRLDSDSAGGARIRCFVSSEGVITVDLNSVELNLVWTSQEKHEKVHVPTFERYGSIVKIPLQLSARQAELYREAMRAEAVVFASSPFATVTVLTSKLETLSTTYREAGVSYHVDFSCDTFSTQLVSERKRLSALVQQDESIAEIAHGVDCLGLALASSCQKITIACADPRRRASLSKSKDLNALSNLQLVADLGKDESFDRLIVSDVAVDEAEVSGLAKRFLKPGGALHVLRRRSKGKGYYIHDSVVCF